MLAFFIFLVLFIYSSLNLKNVDLGYRQHELLLAEERLRQEIDSLQARKAGLLNLERMERVASGGTGLPVSRRPARSSRSWSNGHER